ncbi:DUF2007 domain-containing protein [bacterium]|nr:DUF2007 domain-containing protein [bacterium]
MHQADEWVELCATNTEYEALLIKGLLESNGISVNLKSYKVSQLPFDIGHIGEIKVMVRSADLKDAIKITGDSDNNIKTGENEDINNHIT